MKRIVLPLAAALALTTPAWAHDHGHHEPDRCPINMLDLAAQNRELTCTCTAADTAGGVVYGTGRYTADSYMCLAAVHAGVIDTFGGVITAQGGDGCDRFQGSTRNGVTSQDWGKFGLSIWFTDEAPACPGTKRP